MSPRVIRRVVLVVFVAGIGGMVAGSIADNNGTAVTFGIITAFAAVSLMLVTSVQAAGTGATVTFDEAAAEAMEARIRSLVDGGADEAAVRDLVRDAVLLGRSAKTHAAPRRARSEGHGHDDAHQDGHPQGAADQAHGIVTGVEEPGRAP